MLDLGDVFSTSFEVRNTAGALTTPASNVCTITLPDGTTATPTLTVPSTGVLRLDYTTVQAGRHVGRLVTVNPDSAHTFTFDVDAAATGIISLAYLKAHLNTTVTTNDEELRGYIEAASEAVERIIGPVARRTVTEVIPAGSGPIWLRTVPVISVTSIIGAYGNTAETIDPLLQYLDPDRGTITPAYNSSLSYSAMTVTYVVGRAVVPQSIQLATAIIAKHLWETQRGPAPVSLLQGGEEFAPPAGFAIPRRAEELLAPYRLAPAIA